MASGRSRAGQRAGGAFVLLALLLACTPAKFEREDGGSEAGTGDTDIKYNDAPTEDDSPSGGDSGGAADGAGGDGGAGGAGASDGGSDGEPDVAMDGNQVDAFSADGVDVAGDQTTSVDLPSDSADAAQGDGADGQDSRDGSDSALGVTPTLLGQLLISEVLYDAVLLADDFGEWLEIYNPSPDVTYNLLGCAILDIENHLGPITASVLVPPGAYRTMARSAPGGLPTDDPGFVPDYVYPSVKFDNDALEAVIIKCGDVVVDRFMYDPRMGLSGHSLSVDPAHLRPGDNNLPGSYCPSLVPYHTVPGQTLSDYGTPGKINPPCP